MRGPIGMRPVWMRPVGMDPIGMHPIWMRPVGMDPIGMRPVGMHLFWMRPVGMHLFWMRPVGMDQRLRTRAQQHRINTHARMHTSTRMQPHDCTRTHAAVRIQPHPCPCNARARMHHLGARRVLDQKRIVDSEGRRMESKVT